MSATRGQQTSFSIWLIKSHSVFCYITSIHILDSHGGLLLYTCIHLFTLFLLLTSKAKQCFSLVAVSVINIALLSFMSPAHRPLLHQSSLGRTSLPASAILDQRISERRWRRRNTLWSCSTLHVRAKIIQTLPNTWFNTIFKSYPERLICNWHQLFFFSLDRLLKFICLVVLFKM